MFVGDRAQLPAVGRGAVLDMAELHRITDPDYAAWTLSMRDRESPGTVFDRLAAMNLLTLHEGDDAAREHITDHAQDSEAITIATNDEAAEVNERIRTGRVERGEVDDQATATGSDGLSLGAGDFIQTRRNNSNLGVANRQQWVVQRVTDGTVYVREVGNEREYQRTVALPLAACGRACAPFLCRDRLRRPRRNRRHLPHGAQRGNQRTEAKHAEQEQTWWQAAQRARQLGDPF